MSREKALCGLAEQGEEGRLCRRRGLWCRAEEVDKKKGRSGCRRQPPHPPGMQAWAQRPEAQALSSHSEEKQAHRGAWWSGQRG